MPLTATEEAHAFAKATARYLKGHLPSTYEVEKPRRDKEASGLYRVPLTFTTHKDDKMYFAVFVDKKGTLWLRDLSDDSFSDSNVRIYNSLVGVLSIWVRKWAEKRGKSGGKGSDK